jgi:hypothetical protein
MTMTPETSAHDHEPPRRRSSAHLRVVPAPVAALPVAAPTGRFALPSRALLAGVAALAVAGIGGWGLGRMAGAPGSVEAPAPILVMGGMQLEIPGAWTPARPARGMDAPGVVTFAPAAGLPVRARLVTGPPADASLVPAALRSQLPADLPPPRRARLAGLPAWTYGPIDDGKRVLELTLAPTVAGVLAVECSASPETWSAALGCEAGVRAIASGGDALVPAPDLAFRRRAPAVFRTLDAKRVAGRAALARGRRIAAARKLAGAHRAAAAALAPLAAPGATTETVAALRRAAAGYDAFARAAGRARFIAARKGVVRAEAGLAGALKRLRG